MGRARIIADLVGFSTDSGVITFGTDKEITLTHDPDDGLILKHAATADDSFPELTLQTGDTDIAANDKLGQINFQAPDEGTGTDAILVAASIAAVSEGDFSSSSNATKLSFATGASELAAEKMSLSSGGNLVVSGNVSVGGDLDVTGSLDMSDANLTNVGSIQLDSIAGDGDTNSSITFSGSDVITIATGGTTAATFNANQILTLADDLIIKDGGTIGSASDTDAIAIASDGKVTFTQDIILKDGVNIGSASDTNAIGISSGGVVSVTATTANTSASDGALTVAGGLGVAADASIGDDLRLISDAAVLSFGADSDVTLTHVADTGILLNSTMAIQFNDASQFINAPSATVLDVNATDEIELNATLVDVNANVEISGTTAQVGVSTSTAKDVFNAGMSVKNGATSAGFVEFFEDSDNGTNKVTVIGPASTSDVTLTLPSSAGTLATTAVAQDDATALAIALG